MNNRKTTHRRSNGKLVTVRHRQFPDKPKPCKVVTETGLEITVMKKKHIDHESVPFWHRPLKNENAPFKGRNTYSSKYGSKYEYDKQQELIAVRQAEAFLERERLKKQKNLEADLAKKELELTKDEQAKGDNLS